MFVQDDHMCRARLFRRDGSVLLPCAREIAFIELSSCVIDTWKHHLKKIEGKNMMFRLLMEERL